MDRFPGSEVTNFLVSFFEDSNKEIMGREQKRFYVEMWGNTVRGGGTCKNP